MAPLCFITNPTMRAVVLKAFGFTFDVKKPLPSIKSAWQSQTPKQQLDIFYNLGNKISILLQIHIFSDLHIGFKGWLVGVHGLLYFISFLYTIYFNLVSGRGLDCLLCFCMFGVMTTVSTYQIDQSAYFISIVFSKAYTLYLTCVNKERFRWAKLLKIASTYFYRDDNVPSDYNRICSECLTEWVGKYLKIVTLQSLSFVIASIGPSYSFMHYGKKATLFSVRLPYLNRMPDLEFFTVIFWECSGGLIGFMAFFAIEVLISLLNNTIDVTSRLCVLELTEISDHLEMRNRTKAFINRKLTLIMMKTRFIDQ